MKLKSLLTLGIALPFTAQAASLLTGGHIDGPAFGYVSNADVALDPLLTQGFEPHFHNEGGANGAVVDGVVQVDESEFEPGDLIVVVPELSVTTLNSTSYFWLPETEQAAATNGTPFLGIGLEELAITDWVGGTVSLKLLSITGPGDFLLWQDDGFGGANVFFDGAGDTFNTLRRESHPLQLGLYGSGHLWSRIRNHRQPCERRAPKRIRRLFIPGRSRTHDGDAGCLGLTRPAAPPPLISRAGIDGESIPA